MYELPISVPLKQAVRRTAPKSLWLRGKQLRRTMAFMGDGSNSTHEAAIRRQIENGSEALLSAQSDKALTRLSTLFGDHPGRCRLELAYERRA